MVQNSGFEWVGYDQCSLSCPLLIQSGVDFTSQFWSVLSGPDLP